MNLKVEYVGLNEVVPYSMNSKLHPAEQIEQIKKSIEQFGFRDPIGVWNGEIVEGHGRFIAAKELGITTIPIIRLDDLSDEERRAYALVHNQLTMNSGFDFDLLQEELDSLSIDMGDFGFDERFFSSTQEDDVVVEDEVPEQVATKCKNGNLWKLGGHFLICGDSTDVAVIDRLMDGVKADIAFTSPPYNADFTPSEIGTNKKT